LLLIEEGVFDSEKLQPLYKKCYSTYQKYDKSKIMFFEPGQFPDTLGVDGGIVLPLGFTELPGGNENKATHVLNDHTYCCQVSADMCSTGEPPANRALECLDFHQRRLEQRNIDAEGYGVPLIISEFGACLNSTACVTEIKQVTDICD
jgi:hypothetical protein